jgi:hypothetical protein
MVLKKIAGKDSCLFAFAVQSLFGNPEKGTVDYIRTKAVAFILELWALYGFLATNIHGVSIAAEYFIYISQSKSYSGKNRRKRLFFKFFLSYITTIHLR